MENIHILPTNKPSKLASKDSNGKLEVSDKNTFFVNGFGFTPQNIYITSDEEIKEGDWFLDDNEIFKCNGIKIGYWHVGESNKSDAISSEFRKHEIVNCKKIILTTDQDLIADEFLEWFVKNPSCESVEIKSEIEKLPFPELVKEFSEYYKNVPLVEEPKQETLEEAAEKYANKKGDIPTTKLEDAIFKQGFIDGAKWQQERSYSEEEVEILLETLSKVLVYQGNEYILPFYFQNEIKQVIEQFKKK